MILTGWVDNAWANGSWVAASWGVSVVIDTHDGADPTKRRDQDFKERRERLREQIRHAIEGTPDELEIEDDPVVQRIIAPVKSEPYRLTLSDYEAIHAKLMDRIDAMEMAANEEAEDDLLLLH